jgi:hypothetical protein
MNTPIELDRDISFYFQHAATLRLCLQHNEDDHEFSKKGGQIIYLMDTNIVRFFLNPQAEIRHVCAFGLTGRAKTGYGPATAALTAEFLFSRRLAGQQDKPAFIAPGHGEDVLEVVQGLRNSGQFVDHPDNEFTAATGPKLDLLLERVTAGSVKPEAAAVELRRLVPSIARTLLEGVVSEVTHLQRLYDDDLLRPLALYPGATRHIMELDETARARVRDWTKRITAERPAQAVRKKIERDAEALVQVMLLDDEERLQGSTVRFVMVTADHRIFDAYSKWFWGPEGPNDGWRFILRLPLQYVPLLNILEMPNGIESSDIILRARTALDSLFINLRRVDPGYPHTLSLHRILARLSSDFHNSLKDFYGFNPISLGKESIDLFRQTRRDWEDIYDNCVILNAELMEKRTRASLERLSKLLRRSSDLRTSIYEDQQRILDKVAGRHIAVGNKINIAFLMGSETSLNSPPRAPLALRAKFPRILGTEPFEQALDRLAHGDQGLMASIDLALKSALDHEAFLFAACVAHRCAAWWASWFFAKNALETVPRDRSLRGEWCEIAYLLVSACRYTLPSRQVIENAFDNLAEMEEYSRAQIDQFGLGRTLCEKTSFILIVLYSANLLPSRMTAVLVEKVKDFLPHFQSYLMEAAEALKGAYGQDRTLAASVEMLKMQLHANIVSADVLVRVLRDNTAKGHLLPAPSQVDDALDLLTPKLNSTFCPPILAAECLMARYSRKAVSREEAKESFSAILKGAEEGGYQLELDRAEFARFTEILAAEEGRRSPPTSSP